MNTHKTGLNGAVAAELRGELKAQGLTQPDLSAMTGIPLVSVQRYLSPTRAIDVEVLEKMARALGTEVHKVMLDAVERLAREAR